MGNKTVLALDIGASSGRGIVGWYTPSGGLMRIAEVHRFENGFVRLNGGLYWDYMRIYRGILDCLRACKSRAIALDYIGIDAWAQDYAYIGPGGEVLGLPRCYRDPVNEAHARDYERDTGLSQLCHARKSGAGFTPISTFRQLWYDRTHRADIFAAAKWYLYMPYLFVYLLTGQAGYDNSLPAIGELCAAKTLAYSEETADMLGVLPKTPRVFRRGEMIGATNESVFLETGYKNIPVACTDAHDTASAVSAVADSGEFLWVSSGSYNMFGAVLEKPVEDDALFLRGFVNTRLGDGRVCLMGGGAGMHYIQQCVRIWKAQGKQISYPELTRYALLHKTARTFAFSDVSAASHDMPSALNAAIEKSGFLPAANPYELYEAFCNSLAHLTAKDLLRLENALGKSFAKIYVISGGSQAEAINLRLASALKRPVYAGLVEAAAVGNMLSQFSALGLDESAPDKNCTSELFAMRRFEKTL